MNLSISFVSMPDVLVKSDIVLVVVTLLNFKMHLMPKIPHKMALREALLELIACVSSCKDI